VAYLNGSSELIGMGLLRSRKELRAAFHVPELQVSACNEPPARTDLGRRPLWQDQPELFERLQRRLASYAPNTQRALAADWRMWRAWCAANNREAFPAKPKDLVDYILIHSPPLERDATRAEDEERGGKWDDSAGGDGVSLARLACYVASNRGRTGPDPG
jgi:hypothetical protein